nr:hypothetical protein [Kitasatospora sp. MAP12-44]
MPVFPEEPEIHESLPGPGVPFPRESDAQALSTPAAGSASPVPPTPAAAAVPGPRPGPPRPAAPRPGPPRPGPRAAAPVPGPRRASAAPPVQLVPATAAAALERADEAVDQLLESGREPGDILVLTAAAPHPWQQHELSFGEERYWAQLAEGADVFYADLAISRPVRRDVVVLVLDGASSRRAAQAVQKALTHATALLVVCGPTAGLAGHPAVSGQSARA